MKRWNDNVLIGFGATIGLIASVVVLSALMPVVEGRVWLEIYGGALGALATIVAAAATVAVALYAISPVIIQLGFARQQAAASAAAAMREVAIEFEIELTRCRMFRNLTDQLTKDIMGSLWAADTTAECREAYEKLKMYQAKAEEFSVALELIAPKFDRELFKAAISEALRKTRALARYLRLAADNIPITDDRGEWSKHLEMLLDKNRECDDTVYTLTNTLERELSKTWQQTRAFQARATAGDDRF